MEWDKEKTALLIERFKEKKVLWDSSLEQYKDRIKKHDAWMDLASEFDTEKSVVEKKMRCLIGQFQRELKKPRLEPGAEEVTSKWFGFELLSFLKDKHKVFPAKEAGISQDCPKKSRASPKFIKIKTPEESFNSLDVQKEPYKDNTRQFNTVIKEECYEENQSRDEYTIFGEHIACRLRNLRDPFTVATLQNQIHNLIFEAEMNMYGGGSNIIGS